MPFQVIGEILKDETALNIQIKPYKSKIFYTQESAIKHGYKMVYRKDGNNKRTRNVLIDWYIKTIPFGEMK